MELVEQGKTLASETAERTKQVQIVGDDLTRAAGIKDELLTELARVSRCANSGAGNKLAIA